MIEALNSASPELNAGNYCVPEYPRMKCLPWQMVTADVDFRSRTHPAKSRSLATVSFPIHCCHSLTPTRRGYRTRTRPKCFRRFQAARVGFFIDLANSLQAYLISYLPSARELARITNDLHVLTNCGSSEASSGTPFCFSPGEGRPFVRLPPNPQLCANISVCLGSASMRT